MRLCRAWNLQGLERHVFANADLKLNGGHGEQRAIGGRDVQFCLVPSADAVLKKLQVHLHASSGQTDGNGCIEQQKGKEHGRCQKGG